MLHILGRRAPWVRVVISPVRVQGQGAAREIAAAVAELNDLIARGVRPIDVMVVGRGGGSIEDLWEFNEEAVARAIVQSRVPVVSAVGHEIDFTIADFAADLRAATPVRQAELIVPDGETLQRYVADSHARLQRAAGGFLLRERNRLAYLARVTSPQGLIRTLREYVQRVDMAGEILRRTMQGAAAHFRTPASGSPRAPAGTSSRPAIGRVPPSPCDGENTAGRLCARPPAGAKTALRPQRSTAQGALAGSDPVARLQHHQYPKAVPSSAR